MDNYQNYRNLGHYDNIDTEGGDDMGDTFRKEYTPLTEAQKDQVSDIKHQAEALETTLDVFVPRDERSERSRCMAIARTHLETAIMYAVKAVTTKQG